MTTSPDEHQQRQARERTRGPEHHAVPTCEQCRGTIDEGFVRLHGDILVCYQCFRRRVEARCLNAAAERVMRARKRKPDSVCSAAGLAFELIPPSRHRGQVSE